MSAEANAARCGTAAEYQAHRKRGEEPCADCRKAHAAYMSERRKDTAVRRHEVALEAARVRALWRLARMHRGLFSALYAEESADIVAPPRKVRETECHPGRKHCAKGLCAACYRRSLRAKAKA